MGRKQLAEQKRLKEDQLQEKNWKLWGPYLAERQWGTVREDYSEDGNCWEYFPHDQARKKVYRWGEDGLLGFTDKECRLCFALSLWNNQDPILKERLFGLTGNEGNHGEDCKELYYYLDSTPTHSYMRALYKYPHKAFPYEELIKKNQHGDRTLPEYELLDSEVFKHDNYFDVMVEYAKKDPLDIHIKISLANRGKMRAPCHLIPTLWFRNTWSWNGKSFETIDRPLIKRNDKVSVLCSHPTLGDYYLFCESKVQGREPQFLFTENEDEFTYPNSGLKPSPFFKDAFHRHIIGKEKKAINPAEQGTKLGVHYPLVIEGEQEVVIKLRLMAKEKFKVKTKWFGMDFDRLFKQRQQEADHFYQETLPLTDPEERLIHRQALAGLLWSKQFYHFTVKDWLQGDKGFTPPSPQRKKGRNREWDHLYNHDIISMPDKWEYPWYACWDLAFQMIPFNEIDPQFAREQMILMLREWYMHPNGQLPAYEFSFDDVNPPVHGWACLKIYRQSSNPKEALIFLKRAFHKLLINFTWWVNRKDPDGNNLFAGGFLGLDNIGVFDRSKELPTGGYLEQADGTSWMAFYCGTMLSISLELAQFDSSYEDLAYKFLRHFVSITDAINNFGGSGLWHAEDGFYYDRLNVQGVSYPLQIRSLVGLIPLLAVDVLEKARLSKLPYFKKKMDWLIKHRQDLAQHISYFECNQETDRYLLAIPNKKRLKKALEYIFAEDEFLSPYGIRSLSKFHQHNPFKFKWGDDFYQVNYQAGESDTYLFGGNSNWRGPIWFPINFLFIEALEKYYHYYGDNFQIEFPSGSGKLMNLMEISIILRKRLVSIFKTDKGGKRPCHGGEPRYSNDPFFKSLLLFYEYFHGDTAKGLGASHQTGWTALVAHLMKS